MQEFELFSDAYKDAHGFRPSAERCRWFDALSHDEKQSYYDGLVRQIEENISQEKRENDLAVAKFEETIQKLMMNGAGDKQTAVKWFVDSLGISEFDRMYGADYVCYLAGLPYSMKQTIEMGF